MEIPSVVAICISPTAGGMMQQVQEVEAIAGAGLKGDRYCTNQGSYNKNEPGTRQITLINAIFFKDSGFEYIDSRRNLVINGAELMWLIGREFQAGEAIIRGIKYCDPCLRPNRLAGKEKSFKETFFDRGGLVGEIIKGGMIRVGDTVIPPPKGY